MELKIKTSPFHTLYLATGEHVPLRAVSFGWVRLRQRVAARLREATPSSIASGAMVT